MKVAKSLMDIEIYTGHSIKKNRNYVMAGAVMDQLQRIYPGGVVETEKFENYYRKLNFPDLKEGNKVFLFRSGGVGDVMFMLPLIKYLKEKKGVFVGAATSPSYVDVLKNNPSIDHIVKMPFELDLIKGYDYHLIFEGVIENNPDAEKINAIDLFLKEGGVDPNLLSQKEKIPYLFISEKERYKSKKKLGKILGITLGPQNADNKFVGFQIQSSSPIRNFPLDKMVGIINELIKDNKIVVLFGDKGQREISGYIKNILQSKMIIDLPAMTLSLAGSIEIASVMDVIIAPDSSFIHIAGGLGIPVVGLYGCFPSLLRMRYYDNAIGIDCNVPCAPSFLHGHLACSKGNPSPCFSVISIQNVLDAVNHLLGESKIDLEYPVYNEFKEGNLVRSGI